MIIIIITCRRLLLQSTPQVDFSDNPLSQPSFQFYDQRLVDLVKQADPHVYQFFRLLSLCHTVMPEEKNGSVLRSAISFLADCT